MVEMTDLKSYGMLILALFVIGIIVVLTYIGMDYLKEAACEQNQTDGHVWSDAECQASATNSTAVTIKAVTKANVVEGILDTALGLLALVVIVAIFKLVVKTAKGFA